MRNLMVLFCTLGLIAVRANAAETPLEVYTKVEAANVAYDKVFPQYVEFCAASEYHPFIDDAGGVFGHAFMFVKGACLDHSLTAYPKLKVCEPGEKDGVGVSVDSDYQNVKWTAVEGRSFMFYADVAPDHAFSKADYEAGIQSAVDRGIFRGVKLTPELSKGMKRGESYEHFVARWSFGTNYGAQLARNMHCMRLPLDAGAGHESHVVLKSLVRELNSLNADASVKGSNWDEYSNNCTHTVVNSLAAIGFGKSIPIGWDLPPVTDVVNFKKRLGEFAIPYSRLLEAMKLGTGQDSKLEPSDIFKTKASLKAFANEGWMDCAAAGSYP